MDNKGVCVLNCEVSISDSIGNVCGNEVGLDIDGTFRGEVNGADVFLEDKQVENLKKPDENDVVPLPGDCVSLFVNIFGPPDDIYESEDKGIKDNILLNVANNGTAVEEVEVEEKKFVLGDIVWVKSKTKLWWPGIITDPSNASKAVPKVSKSKDYFLVKQFANLSFVWASLSQLKDFTFYFDEMVKQNKSRTFYGAVEIAVNEIGCHVKETMTCSCFRKEIESSHSQSLLFGQISTGAFSSSQFQPAQFLSSVQSFALDVTVPNKIQVTVTQNCLSAFYRAVGHCQMHIDQLSTKDISRRKSSLASGRKDEKGLEEESPVTKVWDGKESENSKLTNSYQLRERVKSCSEVSTEGNGNKSSIKESGKKCVFGSSAANITKIVNSSSDEMLNDLCWTAVDDSCGGKEGRHSASLKRFYSCFRRFAFLKHEDGSPGIVPDDDAAELPSSDIKPKRKWQRKPKINSESKDSSAVNEGQETRDSTNPEKSKADDAAELPSSGIKPKRKWQRKPKINPESKDSSAVNEGQVGLSDVVTKRKKATGVVASGIFQGMTESLVPDLNANAAQSSVKGFQITGHPTSSVGGGFQVTGGDYSTLPGEHDMFTDSGLGWLDSNGSPMTFVQLLQDVQGRGLSLLQSFDPENKACAENGFASMQSEGNQINFASESSWKQPEVNQINFASQANAVVAPEQPKKRKRKPKEKLSNAAAAVVTSPPVPDLNILESSITTKETVIKPPRKRSKSSAAGGRREVCVQLTPSLKVTTNTLQPRPSLPTNGFKAVELPPGFGPPQRGGSNTPDLAFIKQKLEMMKLTLEKSGDNLSPEVRAKLESEINSFSMKVNSMFGGSSAS